MGVDACDFDGDGWEDLFVANIDQQDFSMYRNNHNETFTDAARNSKRRRSVRSSRSSANNSASRSSFDSDSSQDSSACRPPRVASTCLGRSSPILRTASPTATQCLQKKPSRP